MVFPWFSYSQEQSDCHSRSAAEAVHLIGELAEAWQSKIVTFLRRVENSQGMNIKASQSNDEMDMYWLVVDLPI